MRAGRLRVAGIARARPRPRTTVFLPLTLVAGFFGQDFGWLVGHIDGPAAFVAYGIGGLAVPLALLFGWLRLRTSHSPGP